MEVVGGGCEHGVNGIASTVCKIVAPHTVLGLEMTDHGFDGGAPPQLAFDPRYCLQPDYGRGPIRMAESKSKWFALFINARDQSLTNSARAPSGIDRATIISVVAQDRRSRYDSPNLASRSRANPQKPANDMYAPSATSKHLT